MLGSVLLRITSSGVTLCHSCEPTVVSQLIRRFLHGPMFCIVRLAAYQPTRPALLWDSAPAAATITGVPFLGRPTLFRAVRVRVLSPGRHQFTGTDWLQRTFQVDCDQSTTSNIRRWLTLSIPKRNERVIAKDSSTIQHVAKYTQVLKCHSYQQLTGLWYERNGQQNKFGRHRCC